MNKTCEGALWALAATVIVLALISHHCKGADIFDRLPQRAGWYTFRLHAEEGYSWDGRETITVGPYWFQSQRQAWQWARVEHVRQVVLIWDKRPAGRLSGWPPGRH